VPQVNLRLSRALGDDLLRVSNLGLDRLQKASAALHDTERCIIKPSELRAALEEAVGPEDVQILQKVLIGLATLSRQHHASIEDVFFSLEKAIVGFGWKEVDSAHWAKTGPILKSILSAPSVLVTAKTVDLLYDYQNFLMDTKTLTDIRPIFDDQHTTIVGTVINQTLRIEYSGVDGDMLSMSICIDANDLENLLISCQEAIKKAKVAASLVKDKWNVDTVTISEFDNERS
jgi:hypothetical protein